MVDPHIYGLLRIGGQAVGSLETSSYEIYLVACVAQFQRASPGQRSVIYDGRIRRGNYDRRRRTRDRFIGDGRI